MSLQHILESNAAIAFFAKAGIAIANDSAHNAVRFVVAEDGTEITLWAECGSGMCDIPGIYVDE